jgi:hypothetical protein
MATAMTVLALAETSAACAAPAMKRDKRIVVPAHEIIGFNWT